MNLPDLFRWLAENEWETLAVDDEADVPAWWLDKRIANKYETVAFTSIDSKMAEEWADFLAAAPRTLAEVAVDKVEEEATLIANEMCAENPACNSPDDDYISNALQEFAISKLHYRAVVEKLEKVKGEEEDG